MQVEFSSNALQKAYEKHERAVRRWGPEVARKYIQRIEALQAAETFGDVQAIQAFRVHELEADRKGEWSIKLTRRARLVVILSEDQIEVTVKEVSQHYGD